MSQVTRSGTGSERLAAARRVGVRRRDLPDTEQPCYVLPRAHMMWMDDGRVARGCNPRTPQETAPRWCRWET